MVNMSEQYSYQALIRRGFKTIFVVVIVIAALIWFLWDWEFQGLSISSIWDQTDRTLFIFSIILISTALPCVAMRWRALFPAEEKKRLSPIDMTGLLCVAFVFNFYAVDFMLSLCVSKPNSPSLFCLGRFQTLSAKPKILKLINS